MVYTTEKLYEKIGLYFGARISGMSMHTYSNGDVSISVKTDIDTFIAISNFVTDHGDMLFHIVRQKNTYTFNFIN